MTKKSPSLPLLFLPLLLAATGCVFVGASDNDDDAAASAGTGGTAGSAAGAAGKGGTQGGSSGATSGTSGASGAGAAGASSGAAGASSGAAGASSGAAGASSGAAGTAGASSGAAGASSGAAGASSGAAGASSGAAGASSGTGGSSAGAAGSGTAGTGGSPSTGGAAGSSSAGAGGTDPSGGTGGAAGGPTTGGGETCADPIVIPSLPFTTTGDTSGHTNDAGIDVGVCPNLPEKKGNGSPDLVYAFTAPAAGTYVVTVVPKALYDASLYVTTSCTITKETCLGASDELTIVPQGLGTETVTVTLTAGQAAYVFVDGWANSTGITNAAGAFELSIAAQ